MTDCKTERKSVPTPPPPIDFSKCRSGLETSNPLSSSILDLRVKKLSEETDQKSRNMLAAYLRRTRVTDESSLHTPSHELSIPEFQTSRQNASTTTPVELTSRRRLPANVDAPLYVSLPNHEPLSSPFLFASQQRSSPHQDTSVVPDTTVSNSSPTLPRKRDLDPSQYHVAFRTFAARDNQNSTHPRTHAYLDSSVCNRLPPFSELSLDRISSESSPGKPSTFLPLSLFSYDWKPDSFPVSSSGREPVSEEQKPEEPTSSFPECDFPRGYRRDMADGSGSGSGSDGEQQLPVSSGSLKDESYWERRRKNNEAAKKSRDARRAKEDEIAVRAAVLEKENICLKLNLAALKKEHQKLLCSLK